jgi:hypothetical protein
MVADSALARPGARGGSLSGDEQVVVRHVTQRERVVIEINGEDFVDRHSGSPAGSSGRCARSSLRRNARSRTAAPVPLRHRHVARMRDGDRRVDIPRRCSSRVEAAEHGYCEAQQYLDLHRRYDAVVR